jgi:DNA polymerase-1
MKQIGADFETKPIDDNSPKKPPPVGLAIKNLTPNPRYMSWGHATNNGIYELRGKKLVKIDGDPEQVAKKMYKDATKHRMIGHNIAKFDLAVAQDAWGIAPPSWDKVDDTLFSLFLRDPHASSLSLKPSAERLLGIKPDERNAVFEWLAKAGIIKKPKMDHGVVKYQKDAGAHIWQAPGDLVAFYAIQDTNLPEKLQPHLLKYIDQYEMRRAYDRERQLAPILLANESRGMRIDLPALEKDLAKYEDVLKKVDGWLRKRLKTPGLNLDSDEDTAKALKRAKIVKEFPQTEGGRDSVSKKRLTQDYFSDQKVWAVLYYRNALAYVLISMRKWFEQASARGGFLYRQWNQVRQSHGESGFKGARSGRITVSDFQNITKDFMDRGDGFKEAWEAGMLKGLGFEVPDLPLLRVYCLPDEGQIFGHCDVDQQELKLVAHYEEGALAEEYNRDPKTDIHTFVQKLVHKVSGKLYERRPIKIVDFRTVYGGGVSGLAEQLHIPYKDAKEIIDNWKRALPDVVSLDRDLKKRFAEGGYLRTLGGRVYFCKPPTIAKKGPRKGQMITFAYTALNYLIQPSAADQTKQAIINYHHHPKRKARMVVTVHDEINISMPKGREMQELQILNDCMVGAFKLDVPTTTTRKLGPSWGKLKKIEVPTKKEKAA